MTEPCELSAVLPVYNVGPWLPDCLESIQQQSFTGWEAILVDDGSTDFSGVICDSYASRDSRFRVIHQKNSGVSAARNAGIEAATAPFIAYIDPDDFISKNYFGALVSELKRTLADVAVSFSCDVEENGKEGIYHLLNRLEEASQKKQPAEMIGNSAVVDGICGNRFSCVSWKKVFRRELWADARFPVGVDLGEDMMTVPAVIAKAENAVYVPEAVYYWRHRRKSLLHGTVSKERYLRDLAASAEMVRQLVSLHPNRKDDFLILKHAYDFGCLSAYLQSNPNARVGKSLLHMMITAEVSWNDE